LTSPKKDPLEPGRKMLERMMEEAQKPATDVPFEDKLKLLDRWIKYQELVRRQKMGGMGSGFDEMPSETEDADI
jgi:hypothetical protein